jgi:hypothetical protein
MNASRTPRFPAWASGFVLAAALLLPGSARAEVGVASEPGPSARLVVYVLEITEDPSPIGNVWRKLTAPDPFRIDLNPQGETNGDGMPSVVTDANTGLVAAAWSRNSASGFDIVVSRFVGGSWTVPQVVAGALSASELDPQLVLAPDGSVHLFYWVDGATPQVFQTVAPFDLSSWSAPVLVSQPGVASCRPAGAFHNGVLRVAFEVHSFGSGNTPRQVVLARFENGAFTPEVVAMTNNLGDVRPQVHSHAGQLWVDWVDTETTGGSGELAWTRLNAQGQWEAIQFEPFANRDQRDFRVRGGARLRAIE